MENNICGKETDHNPTHHLSKLNYFIETKKIPHLIFHGSVGTGKKTIVYDFINKIYNDDKTKIKKNVMIVNCAHGKGIKFIREELKFFAKTNIQSNLGVLFKTIVLMNADFLTIDAQSALRRCIELFSYNTRFFIIIENKNKLLKPILSRFCEIYIPEYIEHSVKDDGCETESNKIINLHKYNINRNMPTHQHYTDVHTLVLTYLTELKNMSNKERTHALLIDYANKMYENGLCGIDIMNCAETCDFWTKIDYIEHKMEFNNIKSEYRCEKLLMFYLLDMLYE